MTPKPRRARLFLDRPEARGAASSLTILSMSNSSGNTPSPRNAAIWT
jgi:hypothetical protein